MRCWKVRWTDNGVVHLSAVSYTQETAAEHAAFLTNEYELLAEIVEVDPFTKEPV